MLFITIFAPHTPNRNTIDHPMPANTILTQTYSSPCGELILGSLGNCLCLCDWASETRCQRTGKRLTQALDANWELQQSDITQKAAAQLDEYFSGTRKTFDIPLVLVGTPFQQTVWNHLLSIPYGTTITYGELARKIGMPKAVRAVANANGANVLSIFIPCHRVIGSNHTLTGYAGGLTAKKTLLTLEYPAFSFLVHTLPKEM